MTAPLFFAEPAAAAHLAPGDLFELTGDEGRHASRARRLRVGEALMLTDGAGLRIGCTVADAGHDVLTVRVERAERDAEPAVRIVLAQALAKGDRDELAVQAATELGVDEIVPWQADRSVVQWRGERAERNRQRWGVIVREAVKQSRRTYLPRVHEPVATPALASLVAARVRAGGAAWVLDAAGAESVATAPLPAPRPALGREAAGGAASGAVSDGVAEVFAPASIVLVVGPEGGIAGSELDALTAAGAQLVAIGPHILRTSTAGPAAIAVLSARLTRW